MEDIGFFSTMHCGMTPAAQEDMFLMSIESFLRHNKTSVFHLVLLHKEGTEEVVPQFANKLLSRYESRFRSLFLSVATRVMDSRVLRYALRFGPEVADLVGTRKLVSLDLDMYHVSSIASSLAQWVNWVRVNACLDLYWGNDWVLMHQNTHFRPYLNAGLVAWNRDSSEDIMRSVMQKCEEISILGAEELSSSYRYIEQDALNHVLSTVYPERTHVLPDIFNYSPRSHGNVHSLVSAGLAASAAGTHVLHIMSFQPQRVEFFRVASEVEGWYRESLLASSRVEAGLRIVVISHNQAPSIPLMKTFMDTNFPGVPVVTVLDRCTDDSQAAADACGMPYVVNRDGQGFLAGRMRDLGLQVSGMGYDTLFLDGDRVPGPSFNHSAVRKALGTYDMTIMPIAEGEYRPWFGKTDLVPNPNYGLYGNDVYTCGIVLRASAIRALTDHQGGLLFVKDFDGQFGEEDRYLGDVAYHLGLTCGGFPLSMALTGAFRPSSERSGFSVNVVKRDALRSKLKVREEHAATPALRGSLRDRIKNTHNK